MKKLNKLSLGMKADKQREVCLGELIKVKPHKFKKQIELKGKTFHKIEVEIVEVSKERNLAVAPDLIYYKEDYLLKVIAKAWKDGVELFVDNPLYYHNAPICVPDGTFETKIDEFGKEMQVANFMEDPEEALKQIVLETIRVTSLKE
jgi:hypothetical protein